MRRTTLRNALLAGKRRPRRFGAGSPTTYRGDGYEFIELRAYVPGDDVRRIDWAATARSGDLQTRVVLEDVALTLAAFVDDSASMRIGRRRALHHAAHEACREWFQSSLPGDRTMLVTAERVLAHPSASHSDTFDLAGVLAVAHAALPRGAALLGVSDWLDIDPALDDILIALARRCDCTALVARDPWYDGLPLQGLVRMRGAEGGHTRVWIGKRERQTFVEAVREREARICEQLERLGWRVAVMHEHDGARALYEAFGLAAEHVQT